MTRKLQPRARDAGMLEDRWLPSLASLGGAPTPGPHPSSARREGAEMRNLWNSLPSAWKAVKKMRNPGTQGQPQALPATPGPSRNAETQHSPQQQTSVHTPDGTRPEPKRNLCPFAP